MGERVPYLHICVTCRAGREVAEGEASPGRHFHDLLAAMTADGGPVRVREVACLSLCKQGCAALISAPGKWGYLLGGLCDELAADLLQYGAAYAASATGAVMPSRRPASLSGMVRGRVPAGELL